MLSFLMVGCNTMKKLEREAIETAIVGKVSPQQLTAVDGVVNFNYNIAFAPRQFYKKLILKVTPKMQATVDGHLLQEASINGKFGRNVIVEGPLSFDIALSKEASDMKGFKSEVSGDIDILLVPNIEVGNGIGKSFTYMANAKSAGVIMGAKAPIVLVSRSDSAESKLYSIAYGALIAKDIKKII